MPIAASLLLNAFMLSLFCSNDLSQGVRSSAAAVAAAEQGVRQGAQYLNLAVKEGVIPSVKSKVPAAKGNVANFVLTEHTMPFVLILLAAHHLDGLWKLCVSFCGRYPAADFGDVTRVMCLQRGSCSKNAIPQAVHVQYLVLCKQQA